MLNEVGRRLARTSSVLDYLLYGAALPLVQELTASKRTRLSELPGAEPDREPVPERDLSADWKGYVEPWPGGRRAAAVLTFDDLCPVTGHDHMNYGGDPVNSLNRYFEQFIERYPRVKVTHFVPASMSYDPLYNSHFKGQFSITGLEHANWRRWILDLCSTGRVEVGLHGLYHYNYEIRSPAEFYGVGYEKALQIMKESFELMTEAGFRPVGFRPPAWGVGNDLAAIDVARDIGLKYVAASGIGIGLNAKRSLVSNLYLTQVRGIMNVPQNIILGQPFKLVKEMIQRIMSHGGLISIKGHFTDSYYLAASLNRSNRAWLDRVLGYLAQWNSEIWYATVQEIVEFQFGLRYLAVKRDLNTTRLCLVNMGPTPLHEVTLRCKRQIAPTLNREPR